MRDLVSLTRDQTLAVKCGVLIPGPLGNSQHTDWEKIFAHHVSDKELIFQYIRSSHTSSAKKQSNLIKKWTEDQNRHFSQR